MKRCQCGKDYCDKHYYTCRNCKRVGCHRCADVRDCCQNRECDELVAYCRDCVAGGFGDELVRCSECREAFCSACRTGECQGCKEKREYEMTKTKEPR